MKLISISLFVLIFLMGCNLSTINFDQAYYERTTKIKFPKKIDVLESMDNGEFETITVCKVDSDQLSQFIKQYNFKLASHLPILPFDVLFKKYKPQFNNLSRVYKIESGNGYNAWIYVADLNTNLLYAQILYPDWGGQGWPKHL